MVWYCGCLTLMRYCWLLCPSPTWQTGSAYRPYPTAPAKPSQPAQPTQRPVTRTALAQASDKPQYGGTIDRTDARVCLSGCDANGDVFNRMTVSTRKKLAWRLGGRPSQIRLPTAGCRSGQVPRGCLAESWDVPDALTIIVHLRKGVQFQNKPPVDGREFNADDVVWNLERYRASTFTDHAIRTTSKK